MDPRETPPPPAPWRLKGEAILRLQLLPAGAVEAPTGLRIARVSRGRTLGGVYVAHYGEGSTLRYNELIVFSALVRKGARPGFSVSHIYVDDPYAAAGGHEIWGLPKRLARFQWRGGVGAGQTVAVEDDTTTLCRMTIPKASLSARLPIVTPVWSSDTARLLHFMVTGTAKVALARSELMVPASSPFAALGLAGGRILELKQLEIQVHAPAAGADLVG